MEEFIRFRTGFFRFPDSNQEGKIFFDEEGNIYDKTAEGEYRNCTIYIDNVKYSNATLTILVKKTLSQACYEMSVSATREDGQKLALVKIRDAGYPQWRVKFDPGSKPLPTQRPRV